MPKPCRINVPVKGGVTDDEARVNVAYSASLGLPCALDYPATAKKLAVVGSSPSIDFEALQSWDGDIWAVNGTAKILAERDIPFTMISVDPFNYDCAGLFEDIFGSVEKALLASHCSPALFDFLQDKDVKVFHIVPWEPSAINGGPTTATRAPMLALGIRYQEISFFGLEGSFNGQSHYYKDDVDARHKLAIEAGGVEYPTCVELMVQCEMLAGLIREFPNVLKDRSGGLLSAILEHFDTWEVVAMSDTIRNNLITEKTDDNQGVTF